MKKLYNILFILTAMFTLTWTACTDEIEYVPAGPVEGIGAYFPPTVVTNYELDGTSGSLTLDVMRTDSVGDVEATLTATFTEGGENIFTVPATVSFADGASTSSMTINYDNLVQGTTYNVTLTFAEGTPYGNSSITLTLIYPDEVVYTWKEVSTNAILKESTFSFIGMSDVETTGITVEKANEGNVYRFRVPFDNEYFYNTFGGNVYDPEPSPEEFPWIVIDGETYKDEEGKPLYYTAPVALGFSFSLEGQSVYIDTDDKTTVNFGSVACNLSTADGLVGPNDPDYPLGTYDEAKNMINLGTLFIYVEGAGYQIIDSKEKDIYLALDPTLLETDYDRDYTWMDVPEAAGYFTSEVAGGASWVQAVQVADEDSTFYRLPYLYAGGEKNHLYFHLDIEDEYKVTVPSGQHWTGLTSFGQTVWVEGVTNGSSYDVENDRLTLALNLYLANEDGEKMYDLGEFTETLLWGQTSEFVAADITDFVGNWLVSFDNGQGALQIPVTISQEDDATLKVQGLSGVDPAEYDDTMYLDYDAASGQVAFFAQQVASYAGYVTLVTPLNSSELTLSTTEGFVGGLTRNGSLKFTDAPTNQGTYDSMIYLLVDNGYGMLTGYWNYLEWQPATGAASARSTKFVAPKTFKPTVKKGFKPRRTYKPELNLKAQPVQKKASSMRATMNVSQPAAGNHFSLTR